MAQQYGVAQPIADWVKKNVVNPLEGASSAVNKLPPSEKQDTSWHDSMVKSANDSFRKLADRKLGGKKKTAAKKKKAQAARKRQ